MPISATVGRKLATTTSLILSTFARIGTGPMWSGILTLTFTTCAATTQNGVCMLMSPNSGTRSWSIMTSVTLPPAK